jgi:hypothetical protein
MSIIDKLKRRFKEMSNKKNEGVKIDLFDVIEETHKQNPNLFGSPPNRSDYDFLKRHTRTLHKNNAQILNEYIAVLQSNQNVIKKTYLLTKYHVKYKDNAQLQKMFEQARYQHSILVAARKASQ